MYMALISAQNSLACVSLNMSSRSRVPQYVLVPKKYVVKAGLSGGGFSVKAGLGGDGLVEPQG